MHELVKKLPEGLSQWHSLGARVTLLPDHTLSVPVIEIATPSPSPAHPSVIVETGLHLEEDSGPFLALSPHLLLPILLPLVRSGIDILIYPDVNQHGLKYHPKDDPKLLRYNPQGYNYNDGWGVSYNKSTEVAITEAHINQHLSTHTPLLFLSLHEDSDHRETGYLWTNGINDQRTRKELHQRFTNIWGAQQLLKNAPPQMLCGGTCEEGYILVDSQDPGSIEHWLGETHHIPTILSEAPFGANLQDRMKFHASVAAAAVGLLHLE